MVTVIPSNMDYSRKYCSMLALLLCFLLESSTAQLRTQLQFKITEEGSVGQRVGSIGEAAGFREEYDQRTYDILKFSFLDPAAEFVDLFTIQQNGGEIQTAKSIDRDRICPRSKSCTIQLNVQTNPVEYMHIIKVSIEIVDLNDNAPFFSSSSVSRTISEASSMPGSRISLPTATDPDSPQYGVHWYALIGHKDTFELKQTNNTGGTIDIYLQLKKQLDREVQDSYSVQLVAYDGGASPNSGTVTIDIGVLDINDNNPTFVNQTYEVSVSENVTIGTVILKVHATDPDEGMYGEVVYGLEGSSDSNIPFTMNSTSGEIFVVGVVDHEEKSTYSLAVTARNRDPDSLPTSAKLTINVGDLNDNPPKIKVSGLVDGRVQIPESARAGRFVAHLTVEDPDAGQNGIFDCSLSHNLFKLEQLFETEFKIVTIGSLDRETTDTYDLGLLCTDRGRPSKRAEEHITVEITDINDNDPRFSQTTYVSSILENNLIGASLQTVSASDPDQGNNARVHYELEEMAKDAMQIDSINGNIVSKVSFDHEQMQRYQFQVFAVDDGEPARTASATVVVSIMDKDDEIPRFSENIYRFGVPENQPVGTEVDTVLAIDKDSQPFNQFSYSINHEVSNKSVIEAFSVDKDSGMISTKKSLDREGTEVYKLVMLATSPGLKPVTSSATVLLYVIDMNDNAPYMIFPNDYNNTLFLSSKMPDKTFLTKVNAGDYDSGNNAVLTYQIKAGNEEDKFLLDESTGELYIHGDLSEISYKNYALRLLVKDKGNPPQTVEATLNVVVNRSIPFGDSSILSKQNLTIVISIATISAFVMVILVVAIVAILRQQHVMSNKYRYVSEQKQARQAPQSLVAVPVTNSPKKPPRLMAGSDQYTEYSENERAHASTHNRSQQSSDRVQITRVNSSSGDSSLQNSTGPLSVAAISKDSDNSSDITDSGRGSTEEMGYKTQRQLPRTSTTIKDPGMVGSNSQSPVRPPSRNRRSSEHGIKPAILEPGPPNYTPYSYTQGQLPNGNLPQSPTKPSRHANSNHASFGNSIYNDQNGHQGDRLNSYGPESGKGNDLTVLDKPTKPVCRGCSNCHGDGACCYGSYV